jgi:hypothetical protein
MARNSSALRTPLSVKLDTSSTNIPTSYGSGAGSRVLTGISNCQHLMITSTCETRIAVVARAKSSTTPSATQLYIPAAPTDGEVAFLFDDIEVGESIYIKSDGSAISSGIVTVSVW